MVFREGAGSAEDGGLVVVQSCVGGVDGNEEGGVGKTGVELNLHFLYRIYNCNVSWL